MVTKDDNRIGGGLLPIGEDSRDLQFGSIFSLPKLSELPEQYTVNEPLKIKDQGSTDLCTAYATTAVSEDQEGEELSVEYQFMLTKLISGKPDAWGANLRDAGKAMVKYGAVPALLPKADIHRDGRSFVVDPLNYKDVPDSIAKVFKKDSYMAVSGPYDLFDNIRSTLWKMRSEKRTIVKGILWREEWTDAPRGIIEDKGYSSNGFGHAFKIFGWTTIEGTEYLIAQLSNGEEIGDRGIFYMARGIINESAKYGGMTFKDMPVSTARKVQDSPYYHDDTSISKLWKSIVYFFKKLFV